MYAVANSSNSEFSSNIRKLYQQSNNLIYLEEIFLNIYEYFIHKSVIKLEFALRTRLLRNHKVK